MAVSEMDYMNIGGGVRVKSDTFSTTSNANGAATILADSSKKKIIVGITFTTNSGFLFCISGANSNVWYVRLMVASGSTVSTLPNTALEGTYYYIELD